ncbi:sensor histidine kinase N-terminal domain-containing protein [Jeongeupia sp. USM3]|uniref:sensor histidine kinase N-terminal domain-containing protein n=1 Tax=Jeongeupia sp. USM3 TaxID=1906741 RepID=UPI00089DDA00|nr:sensor histidine kinase N-terminal domain-containing protein [Jeongeupia sp. USM3]AOX99027.1 sensor histidine kinase [Jeongeupia sp. USM3]
MWRAKVSLQRQLLLWLLIPQIVLWLAGAALYYNVATHYANAVTDNSLLQTGRAIARQVQPLDDGLMIDFPRAAQLLLEEGPDDKLFYTVSTVPGGMILGNRRLPAPPGQPAADHPVFYNTTQDRESIRVLSLFYRLTPDRWLHVQVGKSLQPRNRISREILLATGVPLGLLIIAMSVLVWWGVSRGLRPLDKLKRGVEHRVPQDLTPLETESLPVELQSLTQALNQLLSTTNESVSRQRRFIADAAHQLRTPLAGLKSQTELAMRETTPEGLRDRLNLVHASATRSIHLVNQLLTLARSEPGAQAGMPGMKVDLAKLIRDLTAESVPRALAAGMDLGCDSALAEATIDGNPALLRELFINLVENAIKYIPRGSNITVRLFEQGPDYVVEVEDDGNGISDEQKPRVFERFYRVNQNDGNGCGLGMAIVKEIAERHGGRIELADAQPHGLIARVSLPRQRPGE